jgi:hypothetical protein
VQTPLEDEEELLVDDDELPVEDEPLLLDELVPLEDAPLLDEDALDALLPEDVATPEEVVVDEV